MADNGFELLWEARLRTDRDRAVRHQTSAIRDVTEEVLHRAKQAGALAVALTGSTARGQRTAISDLDYHIVGQPPDGRGLPGDVDIVADSHERFHRRLEEGDDFVQWTLRHGCIIHDPDGIMRDAYRRITDDGLWPDPSLKFERADALAHLAERVLAIDDRDAAQEHVRAALTSLARGLLLAKHAFPLARAELAGQLRACGHDDLAQCLERSIYESLTASDLSDALTIMGHLNRVEALHR